ncbi:extracellular solute-binding protein family 1 [Candidatus Vecturithrix granuli]|uniref:Extracellular solute-binding protein family 1 n=1 Tax=Vecturithrix granuli TaxID=1499967 RepID=A0A081C1S4_VECG1|nr:extracellular solute-binding protein family 1 [Candidatus Vecturithrix granuli]
MRNRVFIVLFIVSLAIFWAHTDILAQPTKLVLWSHWASEPIKINFMNAVIEAFEQETGIQVEIVWMEKDQLVDKIVFAFDTSEPDLAYIDIGFSHPRILRSLADLSDLKLTSPIYPDWQLGDIGTYANVFLPIEGVSHAIYYNKDLFKQANITLPSDRLLTSTEFLDIIRKLREAGITPIADGVATRDDCMWGVGLMNAIFRFAGPEKISQLLNEQLNFSDPDIVAALEFWKQVVDAQGYDQDTLLSQTFPEKIFDMTDGRAAINFCGTWIYSKFGATERDQGQVGVLDWFTVEQGKGNDVYEMFWAAGYGINKHSQHLAEAKQFLEFLMTPTAALLWAQHVQGPYPVIVENLPSGTLYGALTQKRNTQEAFTQYFSCPFLGAKALSNMWYEETVKFLMGEHSVEEFVKNMNSRIQVK